MNPPSWITHLSIVWSCFISVTIAVLNAGICILFWNQRRLRVTGNLFFVNLAIADILVGLVAIPWKLLHYLIHPTPLWIISLGTAVDYVLSLSFISICAITYDRYLAIIYPLTYPLRMTCETLRKRFLIIWSLPCLNFLRLICIISLKTPEKCAKYNKAFGFFHFSMLFLATIGIVFAYVRIFKAARLQKKHVEGINSNKTRRVLKFCKAIRCCLGVTVCFVCCWFPRGTYLIARNVYTKSFYGLYEYDMVTYGLMCLSPAINPIIYSLCNRDVKKTLKAIIRKREETTQAKKAHCTGRDSTMSSKNQTDINGGRKFSNWNM